jgi:toxin ParE1/3/4
MNLIWRQQAILDLEQAIDYIAPHNPAAALELYQTIKHKVGLLPEQPGVGRPGRVDGTRELVIYPYIVAYTVHVELGAVIILRILHGARQWPNEIQ